jgi:hypothetical protein
MSTDDIRERLARVEVMIAAANADIAMLHADIHGPPRDSSVRGRLHVLEQGNAAANAAAAAVEAVKLVQQQTSLRRFSRTEKFLGLLFAAMLTGCSLTSTIFLLAHNH